MSLQHTYNSETYDTIAGESGDLFGSSVDINSIGNRIIVGAPKYNSNQGRVKVYEITSTNVEQYFETIHGKSGENYGFGTDVSINDLGNVIAVGADGNEQSHQGYVSIYQAHTGWDILGDIGGDNTSIDGKNEYSKAYYGRSISLNGDGDIIVCGSCNKKAPTAVDYVGLSGNMLQFP